MVAEWYPPCQAWPTAATRAANLASSLPETGWQPFVLVPDRRNGVCGCDWCTSGAQFPASPDLDIRRVRVSLSRTRRTYHRLRSARALNPDPKSGHASEVDATEAPDARGGKVRQEFTGWVQRAARAGEELSWLLGDTQTDWIGVVGQAAIDLVSTEQFDVVWTTSAPFGHSRVGRHLQGLALPWVADLRDPVSRDVAAPNQLADLLVWARRLPFRAPFRRADSVVAATEQVSLFDGSWLGRDPALILSGFDSEEWAAARQKATVSRRWFEIVFAGKIYENYRRPDMFLRGLRRVADRCGAARRRQLRFSYYGRDGALLMRLARDAGVADLVFDYGFMSPADMPQILAGAGALLLLTNDVGASGVPGGKFFEFLAAHRPVLAVPGKDRFVGRVLGETGAGVMADDETAVATTITQWFDEWTAGGGPLFRGDDNSVEEYSASSAARKLATVLDAVAAQTAAP